MIEPTGKIWRIICQLYPDSSLQDRLVMYEVYWAEWDGCPYYIEVVGRIMEKWSHAFTARRQVHDQIRKLVEEGSVRCRLCAINETHDPFEVDDFQPWIVLLTNLEVMAALAGEPSVVEEVIQIG